MFTVKKVKAVLFVLNFLFVEIETQPLAMTIKSFCSLFSKSGEVKGQSPICTKLAKKLILL